MKKIILERVHTNYAHALLGLLRKFWFFAPKIHGRICEAKKGKFTKKEQSSAAAAAPLGFGQTHARTLCEYAIASLIISLSLLNVFAAAKNPAVTASLDRDNAYIGDIIKYTVKAELPEAAYLAVNKNIIFENFETINISAGRVSGEPNVYEIIFELAAYKTGILKLESVGIAYVNASGNRKMFFTPPAETIINSILNTNPEDIKDVKPLKKISIKPEYAAGLGLIFIILVIFIVLSVKDVLKNTKKAAVVVDPQTEALAELDSLLESGAIKNGDARIFYYRAAEILRIYISKKYNFNAMEMTSTELLKKLENIVPASLTRKDMKGYFKIFDLARYAGFRPSEDDMIESLEKTKEFIRKL